MLHPPLAACLLRSRDSKGTACLLFAHALGSWRLSSQRNPFSPAFLLALSLLPWGVNPLPSPNKQLATSHE